MWNNQPVCRVKLIRTPNYARSSLEGKVHFTSDYKLTKTAQLRLDLHSVITHYIVEMNALIMCNVSKQPNSLHFTCWISSDLCLLIGLEYFQEEY